MSRAKSEMKRWAKEKMKGVENTLFPSFTPDLKSLDEDGIRWDVRQSIAHGFFSMMCATETGLTLEEAKHFVAVASDEAKGRIVVTTSLILNSFEENMELMEHAEKVGVDGVLMGYPPTFHPESEEEIYAVTKRFCDATQMHVTLYPSPHFNFSRFHPSGFPPNVLVRLAELPNVVAIKIGELGLYADAHRLVGDKILVGCPVERYVPLLIQGFDMQWMGAGCYEVFQSPEKPYLVEYFNLLLQGKTQAAMDIYWKLTPARVMFEQQFNQTVMSGTYNWHQQKYYQWCVGGNGGLTRQPAMKLHQWEADATRMGFYAIEITPREPDEEFFVGRVNYAKLGKGGQRAEAHAPIAPTAISEPNSDPLQQAIELSQQLQAVLAQTASELGQLPAMIRPMANHGFKSQTGQSHQDWIRTSEALTQQLQALQSSNGGEVEQFRAGCLSFRQSLGRLSAYFHNAPAEAARFAKDEQILNQIKQQMAEREAIVRSLSTALAGL